MRFIKTFVIAVIVILTAVPGRAVTDKEMEEARAITAKAYLRYVNDGSGYLDEVSAKSMTELNSKLKAKEKENIKAFNSVKVPSDYASWDKDKLVEFWAVTFFTSPALDSKGKGARTRVRKQISAMNVSAPAPKKEETSKAEAPKAEPAASPVETPAEEHAPEAAADASLPSAEAAVEGQQDILSDQNAIQEAEADSQAATPEEQSHTWVYVLVLAILVAVVIWLVVYAANLMKRQPGGDDDSKGGEAEAELREQARTAIAKKNEEIKELHKRLQDEENRSANLSMELERMKLEHSRLNEQIQQLREENSKIQQPRASLQRETPRQAAAPAPLEDVPSKSAPARASQQEEIPSQAPVIKVIYLGRANRRGIFVRADRRINPGNTIFRLDTNDGLVGTFHVVDEPEVVDVALSNPTDYLGTGCMGEELEDTAGVTRIVTISAGTAIFENGYWKVLRKTRIRYE